MSTAAERAAFWDRRILDWEASRYEGAWRPSLGAGEWLAGVLSGPTKRRQSAALRLLAPFLVGRRVTEIGCGSGRLCPRLLEAGAADYFGLDHASAAVEHARERGLARARFEVAGAAALPLGADLAVSLGLLDWLDDEELRAFFARHGGADFLHSFSERRTGAGQALHRACRAVDSCLRPRAVRPRFLSLAQLLAAIPAGGAVYVARPPGLRDAVFVSSLPLAGAERAR